MSGKCRGYVIELKPYQEFIWYECPIMGVITTDYVGRALIYQTRAHAVTDANRLQTLCKSNAKLQVRRVALELLEEEDKAPSAGFTTNLGTLKLKSSGTP